MSEAGDSRVKAQTLSQDVFDILRADGVEVRVDSAFGDDDDRRALSDVAMLTRKTRRLDLGCEDITLGAHTLNTLAHVILPRIHNWWPFGDEYEVCPRTYASHECKPTAVASHDLHDESARVREGSRVNIVN